MADGWAPPAHTEIEWQFDAVDFEPVERWLAALGERGIPGVPPLTARTAPARRQVDRYVDTEDWRLGRAGLVLRTRRRGAAVEVTVKDTRPATADGLRQRLELTEALPGGDLDRLGPGGPVGSRVAAIAGHKPLALLLEVRTRRQPVALVSGAVDVAEVALDDTVIVVGPGQRPTRLRRVEVEAAPGWAKTLTPLVEDLRAAAGLRPAALSKFETGLLAAGLSAPGPPPDLGSTKVTAASTLGDVGFAVIRRNVEELLAHEPGTRLGEDPEELHDMRVASRRLRAALALFAEALPERAGALRDELQWMGHALGAVRDLDVQLDDLDPDGAADAAPPEGEVALDVLRGLLVTQRGSARQALLDALDSSRWTRLTASLVGLARLGPKPTIAASQVPAVVALPPLVRSRHQAVVSALGRARRSDLPADYHRLRIRGKRLRYAVEFAAPVYGRPATRFARKVGRVQDALGRVQDAEVAAQRLATLADSGGAPGALSASAVFAMGGMAAQSRERSRRLRSEAGPLLRALDGKAWAKLEAAMTRLQDRERALVADAPADDGRGITG